MSDLIKKLQVGSESRSILIIDDDIELAESFCRILKMFFKESVIATDGEEGLKLFKEYLERAKPFTMVLTDLRLPKKGGLTLIKEIRTLVPLEPVIIVSAYDDAEFMAEAISLDVQGYLLKPLAMPKLFEALEKVLLSSINPTSSQINNIDPITQFPLLPTLESYLANSSSKERILMRLKVDHLMNVYTIIGKEYADEYLRELCIVLKNLQVNTENRFYRIATDELALILEDKELSYADNLAKNMALVAKYFHISENGIIINSTLSIGIAQGGNDLLKYSRLALEKLQMGEGSSISFYTQSDQDKNLNISNGRSMMKMIFEAVENNHIIPYIQPAYILETEKVEFFNSYARIFKDGNIFEPSSFINIAKNASQLSMITRAMIKNSFAIKDSLIPQNSIFIIQLSDEDLHDESLSPYILFWANRYNINPVMFGFEISSSAFSLYFYEKFSLIKWLKKAGYKIIVKEWGLSQSNLLAMVDIKPDYIKLHPDIIQLAMSSGGGLKKMKKVVEIIHNIGSKVVATFIENAKELEFVKTIGVDVLQGYKFGHPKALEDE